MSPWWLMIPILSALIGWFTVQWGVKLFFTIVLPRQRGAWTAQLAKTVSTELFSTSMLEEKVTNPESFQKLRPQLEVHIDDFLRKGLPKAFPVISTFIGERTINQLKEIFMNELETIFPAVMKGYIGNLQQDLNLEQLVQDKINAISTEQIQNTVYRGIGPHINKAAGFGAAFGLVVGLLQFAIVWFTTH